MIGHGQWGVTNGGRDKLHQKSTTDTEKNKHSRRARTQQYSKQNERRRTDHGDKQDLVEDEDAQHDRHGAGSVHTNVHGEIRDGTQQSSGHHDPFTAVFVRQPANITETSKFEMRIARVKLIDTNRSKPRSTNSVVGYSLEPIIEQHRIHLRKRQGKDESNIMAHEEMSRVIILTIRRGGRKEHQGARQCPRPGWWWANQAWGKFEWRTARRIDCTR